MIEIVVGTALELLTVWQLLQVNKITGTPLILVGDMWRELLDWATRHMLQEGMELASSDDMNIPQCVSTVEEAIAVVRPHYDAWAGALAGGAIAAPMGTFTALPGAHQIVHEELRVP